MKFRINAVVNGIKKLFSGAGPSPPPPENRPPTLLDELSESLKSASNGDLVRLEKEGEQDGRLLFVDVAHKLAEIEREYQGILNLYAFRRRQEYERAMQEAVSLKTDLEKLRVQLDESDPDSRIARLRAQCDEMEKTLMEESQRGYNDDFARRYYEAGELAYQAEKEYLDELKEEMAGTKSWIRTEIEGIRRLVHEFYARLGGRSAGNVVEVAQEAKQTLAVLPISFDTLKKVEEGAQEILDDKNKGRIDQLNAIQNFTKIQASLLLPKGLIINAYVLSLIILMGEAYLVYRFLTDTLGYKEALAGAPLETVLLGKLILIFCFAYPLAIGMGFKLPFNGTDRIALLKKIARWGIPALIASLFAIAVPNALKIIALKVNDQGHHTVAGSGSFFDGKITWPLVNDWDFWYLIALCFFLPMVTLVFSVVGSLLFAMASEDHRNYLNLTRRPVFGWARSQRHQHAQNKLNQLRQEIGTLHQTAAALHERWLQAESVARTPYDAAAFQALVDPFKLAAQKAYQTGFDRGCSLAYHEKDETELSLLKVRQKIHKQQKQT